MSLLLTTTSLPTVNFPFLTEAAALFTEQTLFLRFLSTSITVIEFECFLLATLTVFTPFLNVLSVEYLIWTASAAVVVSALIAILFPDAFAETDSGAYTGIYIMFSLPPRSTVFPFTCCTPLTAVCLTITIFVAPAANAVMEEAMMTVASMSISIFLIFVLIVFSFLPLLSAGNISNLSSGF